MCSQDINIKNEDNSYNKNRVVLSESERERIIETFRKKTYFKAASFSNSFARKMRSWWLKQECTLSSNSGLPL